jgi:site-specific recombinase XerD
MESFKKKFLEDMFLKDYAEATKENYFRSVRYFFERMDTKKMAEDVIEEDLRKYFLHLKNEREYKVSALKIAVSGLRFFLRRR